MQEISAALDDADKGGDEERHDLHHGVQYSSEGQEMCVPKMEEWVLKGLLEIAKRVAVASGKDEDRLAYEHWVHFSWTLHRESACAVLRPPVHVRGV